MERENVQLVDDNCSQIEVAFKRMKVGTSRCAGKKSQHHIYNQAKHYHHHQQQLTPQSNLQINQISQQPNQIAQHPDHLHNPNQQTHANQISPNTTRVNPYFNQMFNTNTRVMPKSLDDDTVDRLSSVEKSETISFSSFSTSPLALIDSFSCSDSTNSSSSSFSSPSIISINSMGPYREVTREGQTENFHHNQQNHNQNNNNHQLKQSNDKTKYEDGPPADPDVSVEELAAYLDVQLYIPRKMSYMAELMYT